MKNYYLLSVNKCLKELETSKEGLSSVEANLRQQKFGANELKVEKKQNNFLKFLSQFKDVMIIILLIASIISIVVAIKQKSSSELIDGIIIFIIVLINALLGFLQENKAENALEKLKNMTKPEAKVLRDGQVIKIPNSHLTLGDIVFLEAGDIVPADIRLIDSANLFVDESSLTGESMQILKDANSNITEKSTLADMQNIVFSGTPVTNGRATGVVLAIGKDTEIGKIATVLAQKQKDETPLQKNLKYISKIITIIVMVVAVITLVTEIVLRPGEPLLEAFLIAVALAVAAIPESLPAVITIIMSIGVSMLAKKNVIVKKLQAVETLGSCNIICSDKTGTITQNLMTVKEVFYSMQKFSFDCIKKSEDFERLLSIMTLCNDSKQNKNTFFGDSTETALVNFSFVHGYEKNKIEKTFERIDEISFSSQRKLMSTLNVQKEGYVLNTKGGIDNVLSKCSKIQIENNVIPLTDEIRKEIEKSNEEMALSALRVLAFAYKPIKEENLKQKDKWEENLIFVGLVGMIDPPRAEVKGAIEKCKIAGIRPIMITGDHKATAFAIAKEVGIANHIDEVMLGIEIDKCSQEELLQKLQNVSVFARVSPENKVRIVEGFKALGNIVAMTGDGVNDALSLKTSSIGVGMGITGTDITKDVADIIIADDNFATIVLAVEEGRKIYKNIQKTIKFLFSANLGELLSIFLATLIFPANIFMLPIHILFINLITDGLPSVAMSFEPAETNLMKTKPRNSKSNMFSSNIGISIILIGIIQSALVLSSFYIGQIITNVSGFEITDATTMAFVTLNLMQLFYIFSVRFDTYIFKNNIFKNKMQLVAFLFGIIMLFVITLTPLHVILKFSQLNIIQWLIAIGVSILILPIAELVKFLFVKKVKAK